MGKEQKKKCKVLAENKTVSKKNENIFKFSSENYVKKTEIPNEVRNRVPAPIPSWNSSVDGAQVKTTRVDVNKMAETSSRSQQLTPAPQEVQEDRSRLVATPTEPTLAGAINAAMNQNRYGVNTANRFQALSDMDTDDECESDCSSDVIRAPKRPPRPPPIVIHGVLKNTKSLLTRIEETTKTKKFHLKYSENRTNIFFENMDNYNAFRQTIGSEVEYHTYTPKEERTRAYVMYNLNSDLTEEEIQEELRVTFNLDVTKVTQLKNTKSPIYMVILKNKITTKQLNTQCNILHYTKIRWANYENKRALIQCKRCQEWGHATSNCFSKPRCVKCIENHLTNECTQTERDKVQCCNCRGKHPANSVNCPTYIKMLDNLKRTKREIVKTEPPKRYVPAPPPTTNRWTQQQPQQQQQQQPNSFPPLSGGAEQNKTEKTTHETNTNMDDFNALIEEFKTLDKLTDVNFMLNAVRDLNNKLKLAKTKLEQFKIFYDFCQHLDG